MSTKIEVKSDENNPIAAEVMEQAIVDIARAMKKLSSTRLKRETIVALIHDKSGLTKSRIELVLNNLENLEETWLKKKGTRS